MPKKREFTSKQEKAIELLANADLKYTEIAEEIGIAADTLRKWRRDPKFQEAVRNRCRHLLRDAEPLLYKVALRALDDRQVNPQLLKVLLDRLDRLDDVMSGGPQAEVMFTWKSQKSEGNITL